LVRIFNDKMQQVTLHAKDSPGRFSTNPKHIVEKKRSRVERGATWMLQKTQLIGPHSGRWAESVIEARGVEGVRVLLGLMSLAKKHPYEAIELACETALTYGAHRLRTIRELIKRQAPKQKQFDFLDEHPIIRSLSDYGDLVRDSFRRQR
jgi:hypothetical protein